MTNWFISVNGEQKGPYPTDQLRQLVSDGFVPRDAYVWREGMAQWQPLSQVRISDDGPAAAPSPILQQRDPIQSQQYSQQAYVQQSSGYAADAYSTYVKPGYFSFQGRIGRKTYWLSYVLTFFIIMLVVGAAVGAVFAIVKPDPESPSPIIFAVYGILAILYIVLVIAGLSAGVKRLHDRGRSGWFILLMLVPLVQIWIMIEIYFLKGTDGPNAYGPDPLS